jgi:hypothetical protein
MAAWMQYPTAGAFATTDTTHFEATATCASTVLAGLTPQHELVFVLAALVIGHPEQPAHFAAVYNAEVRHG